MQCELFEIIKCVAVVVDRRVLVAFVDIAEEVQHMMVEVDMAHCWVVVACNRQGEAVD